MQQPMHNMLTRQLKRHLGRADAVPSEWLPLIQAVNDAYREFDKDRGMLERSLELSSEELIQANADLRESEERFKQVAESAGEWIWEVDADGLYVYASPGVEKILGYKPEEVVGKMHFYDLLAPEEREELKKAAFDAFARRAPFSGFVNPNLHSNGSRVILETSGVPVLDEQGTLVGYRGVDADITERQQREAEYASIIDTALDGFWIADSQGRFLDVNEAYCRLIGYKKDELLNMTISAVEAVEKPEETAFHIKRTLERGGDRFETRHRCKDGRIIDVEVGVNYLDVGGGRLVVFIRDITERKRAEKAIQDLLERSDKDRLALLGILEDVKRAEESARRNQDTQAAMNAVLSLSMEGGTITEFLDRALDLVLSLEWLAFESKGGIFLADEAGKTLHLQVHRGWSKDLLAACSTVPISRCLCGRAAAARAVQFADCVDERHDIRYESILPHGHYCVPILSGDHVLGVINLYVKEGHARNSWEEEFLKAMANTLAGAIERKRAEEQTAQQFEELRRWHSVTLNREDRILELKREVNELGAKLGEKPKYGKTNGGG